jgi:hypothetical protein
MLCATKDGGRLLWDYRSQNAATVIPGHQDTTLLSLALIYMLPLGSPRTARSNITQTLNPR